MLRHFLTARRKHLMLRLPCDKFAPAMGTLA